MHLRMVQVVQEGWFCVHWIIVTHLVQGGEGGSFRWAAHRQSSTPGLVSPRAARKSWVLGLDAGSLSGHFLRRGAVGALCAAPPPLCLILAPGKMERRGSAIKMCATFRSQPTAGPPLPPLPARPRPAGTTICSCHFSPGTPPQGAALALPWRCHLPCPMPAVPPWRGRAGW